MPKVFRPTLKSSKQVLKQNESLNADDFIKELPKSPVRLKSPIRTTNESQIVADSLKHIVHTTPSSTDLDVDVNPEVEDRSRTSLEIKLFKPNKSRRSTIKTLENLPAIDEPLDRSSVTLRSLLSWVPSNNPPPIYRQERSKLPPNHKDTLNDNVENISQAFTDTKENLISLNSNNKELDPLAPQLRLDADGNIVIDEESLLVSRIETIDTKNLRHVDEETGVLSVNYNSFRSTPSRGFRWTSRETVKFYRALSTIGTDFFLMEKMFHNRSRYEIKRKFKREEKINPYLVDQALRNRRNYDLTVLLPSSDEEGNDEKKVVITKPKRRYRKRCKVKCENPEPNDACNATDTVGLKRKTKSEKKARIEAEILQTINTVLGTCENVSSEQVTTSPSYLLPLATSPKSPTSRPGRKRRAASLEKMIAWKTSQLGDSNKSRPNRTDAHRNKTRNPTEFSVDQEQQETNEHDPQPVLADLNLMKLRKKYLGAAEAKTET